MTLPLFTGELLQKLEVTGPRYTSYPTVPDWSDRFGPTDYAAALRRAGRTPEKPLSLYVHIPFCREMCTYCGCNVVATRDRTKADRYLDGVAREAAIVASHLGERRSLSRLHLGGGTPTYLDERQLLALWHIIERHFHVLPDAEIAVEIDPVVTRREQLALLRGLGFNRLSMGVQDFDERVQRAVNRIQTVEETRAVISYARQLGFQSVNFDLIYGLPFQTVESWRETLTKVELLRPDRIATFSFAYVPEARPHQKRLPSAEIPRGVEKLALFRTAWETLTGAGYRAIGMDHYALPNDELSQAQEKKLLWRDFQGYTTERAADTVALGATGIGDVGGAFAQNVRPLGSYESALADGRLATQRGLVLTDDDKRRRAVIIDLMCNFSVDLDAIVDDAPAYFAHELEDLHALAKDQLVELDGTRVKVLPLGRLFIRNVAMVFDAWLAHARAAQEKRVFSSTI